MIQLTKERLHELRTDRGGFTYATLRELGVEFGPKGPLPWHHFVVGTWVADDLGCR